ncbi:MAG TPA: DUF6351 family protein [Vicinamibacterales bacterium]|nr:DUF6351 family protein [Vicinamibacterales bacterium]
MRYQSAFVVGVIVAVALSFAEARTIAAADALTITTLSSRADLVSGNNALVEIRSASGIPSNLTVTVNNRDVTAAFRVSAQRRAHLGLIEGLAVGRNTLVAQAGAQTGRLEITNYPITGPILSGAHLTPFLCNTVQAGLGEPLDAHCTAATRIEYFYKSNAGAGAGGRGATAFKPFVPAAPRPADLAQTTTSDARTVPYIVRVESGTINRAIYRLAILDDPSRDAGSPWTPGSGWNGAFMMSFGGGCGTNYNQGTNQATGALFDAALSRGFAHAISTQNVMQQHCNDSLSGEALMMIKEHFIERYGVPKWTMGYGGSGGAIQQLLIGQNFPGLLDGIMPSLTFADSISVRPSVTDCRLLMNYYKTDPATWSKAKQTAVEGYTPGTCTAWDRSYINVIVADYAQGCGIPKEQVYDPVTNPKGARCTMWETNVATFGRDPQTGFARRSLDNRGVQYGLAALNSAAITPAEFVDLNRKIGGFDNDGKIRAARTVADPESVRMAYVAGRLDSGAGGLSSIPILQYRSYNDPAGDIHSYERDFTVRERLRKANGRVDNQVIWIYPSGNAPIAASVSALAIDTMSQWLDRLAQDTSTGPAINKVVRAKPAVAVDGCWTGDGKKIDEPLSMTGAGQCASLYPPHSNPRLVAGAPLADDVLKCQLKPVDAKQYSANFTAAQMQELRQIFSAGVCDYSKPGVNQHPLGGTYQRLPLTSGSASTAAPRRPDLRRRPADLARYIAPSAMRTASSGSPWAAR